MTTDAIEAIRAIREQITALQAEISEILDKNIRLESELARAYESRDSYKALCNEYFITGQANGAVIDEAITRMEP